MALRVYGWIAQAHPVVCILTDGSGGASSSRIKESTSLLRRLGAEIGPICGKFTDRQVYEHILEENPVVFEEVCDGLAQLMVESNIDEVISDAIEGYNPTHDLCEVLARNAAAIAASRSGRPIQHYTMPVTGDPRPRAGCGQADYKRIQLSTRQWREKLETARIYCVHAGPTLRRELGDMLQAYGEEAFAQEYLFPAVKPHEGPEGRFQHQKPYYESYGETQVAEGHYQFVIRFREHILPLTNRLDALGLASHSHELA
ncbi:MAG TPA: hypothetical protein VF713_21620 [Thermoanaerobaculia bacterium]